MPHRAQEKPLARRSNSGTSISFSSSRTLRLECRLRDAKMAGSRIGMVAKRFPQPCGVVRCEIEGIGTIENKVGVTKA